MREACLFRRDAPVEDGDHDDLNTVSIHQLIKALKDTQKTHVTTEVNAQTKPKAY